MIRMWELYVLSQSLLCVLTCMDISCLDISLKKISKEWIRDPMNMALFVWIQMFFIGQKTAKEQQLLSLIVGGE